MISVSDAEKLINDQQILLVEDDVQLQNAYGLLTAENINCDRDLPPFHRVAMDGIAINTEGLKSTRSFEIAGTHRAGVAAPQLTNPHHCFEVMTGCILPNGANAVIKVEDLKIITEGDRQIACIQHNDAIPPMFNIHPQGSDKRSGELVLPEGVILLAPQIAIAASVGKSRICVKRKPRFAVISTGDELVDIDDPIEEFQIRRSNVYAIQIALQANGFPASTFHINDDKNNLFDQLSTILHSFDAVIISGGVSMGKFDFVPQVLADLNVSCKFHKVKQRPGKPLWFGVSQQNKPVFALPGNPVSSLVGFYRYILPWLNGIYAKRRALQLYGTLTEAVTFTAPLTYFQQIKITATDPQGIHVTPITTNGSGDFSSLLDSDGFVQLSATESIFAAGDSFPLFLYDGI